MDEHKPFLDSIKSEETKKKYNEYPKYYGIEKEKDEDIKAELRKGNITNLGFC